MEFLMSEVRVRVCAIVFLVLTASLVASDSQTKVIIFTYRKKATYHDLQALKILVYIASAAAAYNFLQLCIYFVSPLSTLSSKGYLLYMTWFCFLLDQMAVYITFGANTGAMEGAMIALKGEEVFEWTKVCNRFSRFCYQIGAALLFGYLASIFMALISSLSAYKLFRFYSPNSFLRLKSPTP
ncbi:CASP-like protein 2C1 [Senna tora]|uniref:CASP-like protein n=1 Tax=Senna tora TaxID=362788 RepID=A0A834X577_9FABA|nr:CASP-like protein 2C1 [Senna tora]